LSQKPENRMSRLDGSEVPARPPAVLKALAVPPNRGSGRRGSTHNKTLVEACLFYKNPKSGRVFMTLPAGWEGCSADGRESGDRSCRAERNRLWDREGSIASPRLLSGRSHRAAKVRRAERKEARAAEGEEGARPQGQGTNVWSGFPNAIYRVWGPSTAFRRPETP
jgi:hypothetical protein